MIIHIWISITEYPDMDIHIWIPVYGYPYINIHICLPHDAYRQTPYRRESYHVIVAPPTPSAPKTKFKMSHSSLASARSSRLSSVGRGAVQWLKLTMFPSSGTFQSYNLRPRGKCNLTR